MKKVIYFPIVKQENDYSCGVACTSSILKYFNLENYDFKLLENTLCCNENGTDDKNIISLLKDRDLLITELNNLTIDNLIQLFKNFSLPIIIDIQAYKENENSYKDQTEFGHYVIFCGYDNEKLIFMDSWLGEYVYLTEEELDDRWHDDNEKGWAIMINKEIIYKKLE